MADIASLSFQIDSTQAQQASANLDKLRGSTLDVVLASKTASIQALDTQHSLGGLADQTKQLANQLDQTSQSYDALMQKMRDARRQFDQSADSLKAWDQAAQQVNALGRAFGTTAAGLDQYNEKASQLGFTSLQTAQSLQRITLALENQTQVGAQLRRVMSEYGVDLRGLNTDQPTAALTKLADAFGRAADTAKRTRDIQSVLGTLDPDALGRVVTPNYVPIAERRVQQIAQTTDLDNERRDEATRQRAVQTDRNSTRYADLQSSQVGLYFPGERNRAGLALQKLDDFVLHRPSNLTDEQLEDLRLQAPEDSAFRRDGVTSFAGRLAAREQIAGMDLNPGAGASEGVQRAARAATFARRPLNEFGVGPDGGMIGREYTRLTNGSYGANDREINQDAADAYQDTQTYLGRAGVFFGGQVKGVQNLFGYYQARNVAPAPTSAFDSVGAGGELAGYGDDSLTRFQQADLLVKSFGRQAGTATNGDGQLYDQPADARGGIAAASFAGVYGADGAQQLRFQRARAEQSRASALRPGAAAVDQADIESSIAQMPPADQGRARAFIQFAQSRGAPASLLKNQDLATLLDPSRSGGGAMNPQLVRDFNQSYAVNSQASHEQFVTQSAQQMIDLDAQGAAAATGATGTVDKVTYQQAYNKALTETSSIKEAEFRANAALLVQDTARLAQGKEMLANLERTNDLESQRQAALADAGTNPAAYGAAKVEGGIDVQVQTAVNDKKFAPGSAEAASYRQQLLNQSANQGTASARDKAVAAQQEQDDARQSLSFTGQSTDAQNRLNRELQITASFRDDINKAAGNPAALARIEQEISRTKELKDATQQLADAAKLYNLGNASEQTARNQTALQGLPQSQRALAGRLAPIYDQARDSGIPVDGIPGVGSTVNGSATQIPGVGRALLNTIAGPESGGRYDIRYDGGNGSTFAVGPGLQHPNIAAPITSGPYAGSTSTAAGRYQMLNTTFSDQQQKLGLPDFSQGSQDAAAYNLARETYKQKTGGDLDQALSSSDPSVLSGVGEALRGVWPTLPAHFTDRFSAAMNGQAAGTAGLNRAVSGATQQFDAENAGVAQGLQEGEERTVAGTNLSLTRQGRTADLALQRAGVPNLTDPNGQLRANLAVAGVRRGFAADQAQTSGATDRDISQAERMTKATMDSSQAVFDLTDKLKVEEEVRTQGLSGDAAADRISQLRIQRAQAEGLSIEQTVKQMKDQNDLATQANGVSIFASADDQRDAAARAQLNQKISQMPAGTSQADIDDLRNQTEAKIQTDRNTEAVDNYRSAWQSAEQASSSALNSMILHGGSAKQVLGGLLDTFAELLLKVAEKPLLNAGGNFLGSLFGASSTSTVGMTTATGGLYAAGGAFAGGVRMMAGGGILDRPTQFMADGGLAVAGEAGNEAVMPIKRMANGNLGVEGSGGGGRSISVSAPITVQAGASSKDGTMDPAMLANIQRQLAESVRVAVVAGIADEKRPGGSLY